MCNGSSYRTLSSHLEYVDDGCSDLGDDTTSDCDGWAMSRSQLCVLLCMPLSEVP